MLPLAPLIEPPMEPELLPAPVDPAVALPVEPAADPVEPADDPPAPVADPPDMPEWLPLMPLLASTRPVTCTR
jgi:hypothetical protein